MLELIARKRGHQLKRPVVYTMGKVGSSAYASAINRALRIDCFDIHTLDPVQLKRIAASSLRRAEFPAAHVCISMARRDLLRNTKLNHFVTAAREPVSRNLSAFFENLRHRGLSGELTKPENARALFETFVRDYDHFIPATWFDREFRDQLGIDVLDLPFDKKRKAFVSPVVTVLRTDASDEVKSAAISEGLKVSVTIERANVGAEKFGPLYAAVRSTQLYPPSLVDDLYATRYAETFFTQEELQHYRAKWTEGEAEAA